MSFVSGSLSVFNYLGFFASIDIFSIVSRCSSTGIPQARNYFSPKSLEQENKPILKPVMEKQQLLGVVPVIPNPNVPPATDWLKINPAFSSVSSLRLLWSPAAEQPFAATATTDLHDQVLHSLATPANRLRAPETQMWQKNPGSRYALNKMNCILIQHCSNCIICLKAAKSGQRLPSLQKALCLHTTGSKET